MPSFPRRQLKKIGWMATFYLDVCHDGSGDEFLLETDSGSFTVDSNRVSSDVKHSRPPHYHRRKIAKFLKIDAVKERKKR